MSRVDDKSATQDVISSKLQGLLEEERRERQQIAAEVSSLQERERRLTELLQASESGFEFESKRELCEHEREMHKLETECLKLKCLIAYGSWWEQYKARKRLRKKLMPKFG
jgi:hypothetical protein